MKRIAFYSREFRLCEWPTELNATNYYSRLENKEIMTELYKEDMKAFNLAVTSAMENGVPFADQKEAKFCVHCLLVVNFGIFDWPPVEGDHWNCPFPVEIQLQLTEDGGKTWIECPEPTYNYYKKLTTINVRKVAVLKSESVEKKEINAITRRTEGKGRTEGDLDNSQKKP